MKNLFQYLQYVIIATIFGCGGDIDQTIKTEFPDLMTITLENNSELSRIDEAVFLDVKLLKEKNPEL